MNTHPNSNKQSYIMQLFCQLHIQFISPKCCDLKQTVDKVYTPFSISKNKVTMSTCSYTDLCILEVSLCYQIMNHRQCIHFLAYKKLEVRFRLLQ
jgi:hypothetical protein